MLPSKGFIGGKLKRFRNQRFDFVIDEVMQHQNVVANGIFVGVKWPPHTEDRFILCFRDVVFCIDDRWVDYFNNRQRNKRRQCGFAIDRLMQPTFGKEYFRVLLNEISSFMANGY